MPRIGCSLGKIAQVTHSHTEFIMKFENDEGIFNILSFPKENQQLKDIAELLFGTPTHLSPTKWVGTRVNLFFGPKLLSNSNSIMLYGIGKENGNTFVIPEYLFEITSQRMEKKYYSLAEVHEVVELVENAL